MTTRTNRTVIIMRIDELDPGPHHQAAVVAVERLTPESSPEDVRELTLAIDGTGLRYEAGQSIGVIVPGPHAFGPHDHLRLYTVAEPPALDPDGRPRVTICVRRCSYLDPYSGERYRGIASNYLCDRRAGDAITVTGPIGAPFEVPDDHDADLLLIGLGTGIAPFRALVTHLYRDVPDWHGRVTLFYGARTGLEMLYMNERRDDFAGYLDQDTFRAFQALSPRPHWDEPVALGAAIEAHRDEVWRMLGDPRTRVFVAGLASIRDTLDETLAAVAGSPERWERRKAELVAGGRWVELVY